MIIYSDKNIGGIDMKKHHTFCENCREEVSYTVTSAPMSGTIRGTEYPYSGKESTCSNCGAPVYVAEINDFRMGRADIFPLLRW